MPNIDAAIAQTWLTVGPLPVHGCRLLRQAARRATRVALALQAYNGNVGDAVAAFREVTNGDARNFTHTRRHAHTDTRAPASFVIYTRGIQASVNAHFRASLHPYMRAYRHRHTHLCACPCVEAAGERQWQVTQPRQKDLALAQAAQAIMETEFGRGVQTRACKRARAQPWPTQTHTRRLNRLHLTGNAIKG